MPPKAAATTEATAAGTSPIDEGVTLASVTHIIGRTGSRGNVTQVRITFLTDQRTLLRNVKGPVKVGDVLALMENEREARRLR